LKLLTAIKPPVLPERYDLQSLQTQPDCNGESGQLQARIDVSMPQNMQVIHLRCVKQF
jgi:hypothetical protein